MVPYCTNYCTNYCTTWLHMPHMFWLVFTWTGPQSCSAWFRTRGAPVWTDVLRSSESDEEVLITRLRASLAAPWDDWYMWCATPLRLIMGREKKETLFEDVLSVLSRTYLLHIFPPVQIPRWFLFERSSHDISDSIDHFFSKDLKTR